MPFAVSSLDVYYLVKELRPLIEESFIDKIYQSKEEKGELLIKMRSPKSGKQQLFCKIPDALFLTSHRFSWPDYPPGFCMQLRKHLSSAQLKSISQHSFDRIVILDFEKGPAKWRLVVELFSKGNIVLVNSDGLIRGVMDLQRWKDREVRVNAPYEFPPPAADPRSMSQEDLAAAFSSSGKELVRFCATGLGLGGKYAEELVARSALPKDLKSLSQEQLHALHGALQELFVQDIAAVTQGDAAAPFPLHAFSAGPSGRPFSEVVEELVVTQKVDDIEEASQDVTRKHVGKWQRVIDDQTALLQGYEKQAAENQRKGELIYEKYQELSTLLEKLKSLQQAGGWDAVKAFIKEKGLPIKVDEKDATVTVEVEG